MNSQPFTTAALDQLANCLVNDRDTHKVLDRKFAELGIREQRPDANPSEEANFKAMGLQRDIHYYVQGPSKRDRLRNALDFQNRRSGNKGVLQLIKALNEPVVYVGCPEEFKEFCAAINRILRFHGVEYRDDGEFYNVAPTRTLTEAERRAKALQNRMASRRIHPEVRKFCQAEYMQENYFHAALEAYKGLAERIRERTGLASDGVVLMKQAFERPSSKEGGYPTLAFNDLSTTTQRNEHDGFLDMLIGCTKLFRNPMSHTPKLKWGRDIDDAVDCLTLISLLNFVLDDCYPTTPPRA